MTTTTETPTTKEEIALKYYTHNLNMCKEHVESNIIAPSKKQEMAMMIDTLEALLKNYIQRIENINTQNSPNYYHLENIYKLEMIQLITKF